jgi:hypothetical protein
MAQWELSVSCFLFHKQSGVAPARAPFGQSERRGRSPLVVVLVLVVVVFFFA